MRLVGVRAMMSPGRIETNGRIILSAIAARAGNLLYATLAWCVRFCGRHVTNMASHSVQHHHDRPERQRRLSDRRGAASDTGLARALCTGVADADPRCAQSPRIATCCPLAASPRRVRAVTLADPDTFARGLLQACDHVMSPGPQRWALAHLSCGCHALQGSTTCHIHRCCQRYKEHCSATLRPCHACRAGNVKAHHNCASCPTEMS